MIDTYTGYSPPPSPDSLPPLPRCIDEIHPDLFRAIHTSGAFPGRDMIEHVGLEPLFDDEVIAKAYADQRGRPGFDVANFVSAHFDRPIKRNGGAVRYTGDGDFDRHAHAVLMSHRGTAVDGPSTIGAPNEVVESGGRYSDTRPGRALWYYWDTEPTVIGLDALGETALATGLVDNIRDQVIRFERPPRNGNAPEYKRSQPAIYCRLVRRDVRTEGPQAYERHLPAMLIEYWSLMDGADDTNKLGLAPGSQYKSVRRMPDGSVLNAFSAEGFTYADGKPRWRPESRPADVKTRQERKEHLGRELTDEEDIQLAKDLHAGGGAGTDFADWMLGDGKNMHSIRTTKRITVLQNGPMFELECTIADAYRAMGDEREAERYERLAMLRARAVNKYLWDEYSGNYVPYDTETGIVLGDPHLYDNSFAIESGMSPPGRSERIARNWRASWLAIGGLRASLAPDSKQSWSARNGWPNLQVSAAKAAWLANNPVLETKIGSNFTGNIHTSWEQTGYGKERYDVTKLGKSGRGGEYSVPDHNFSWDAAGEVALRRQTYRNEAEYQSWLRRRNIASGVGRTAAYNS